jgi:GxxExxY protein
MHPDFAKAAGLTGIIIGAAMEVHRDKGPGLIESIYEWCFERELEIIKVPFVTQKDSYGKIQGVHPRRTAYISTSSLRGASWLR